MESVWTFQGHNTLVELSTQQVVLCDSKSSGCNGDGHDRALKYVIRAGWVKQLSDYPYVLRSDDVTAKCNYDAKSIYAKTSGLI